ncbi:hypothetical protein ARMSODRAFT_972771 [Armillaria solidipes]|uniref:Uncharacterized protein n=1 Tax=Armillaria solidipes TaxID=1076256 RepID=A0A2H3BYM7_9AGAR|nr:hypothetical protein ARMSODRAFT_972771 [Armillaria solidipes]
MKRRYAKKVGNPVPRRKKIQPAPIPAVHPAQGRVVKLIRNVRMANAMLIALTDNSVVAYVTKLCSAACHCPKNEANLLVNPALERVQAILDDAMAAHGAIYTEMGICPEWKEGDVIVKRIQRAVGFLEEISCHILEQDLLAAWEARTELGFMEPPSRFNDKQLNLIGGWVPAFKREKASSDVPITRISPFIDCFHLTYADWYPPEFDESDLDRWTPHECWDLLKALVWAERV